MEDLFDKMLSTSKDLEDDNSRKEVELDMKKYHSGLNLFTNSEFEWLSGEFINAQKFSAKSMIWSKLQSGDFDFKDDKQLSLLRFQFQGYLISVKGLTKDQQCFVVAHFIKYHWKDPDWNGNIPYSDLSKLQATLAIYVDHVEQPYLNSLLTQLKSEEFGKIGLSILSTFGFLESKSDELTKNETEKKGVNKGSLGANYTAAIFYIMCRARGVEINRNKNDMTTKYFVSVIVEDFHGEIDSSALHNFESLVFGEESFPFPKDQIEYLKSLAVSKKIKKNTVYDYLKPSSRFNFSRYKTNVPLPKRIEKLLSVLNHLCFKNDPRIQPELAALKKNPASYLGIKD